MTAILIDEYQDAMREGVCNMCVSFAEDRANPGQCIHESSGECTLFAHLGAVVDACTGVDSGSIAGYTARLRERVCAKCDHQDARGVCDLRDGRAPVPKWCVLDAYFNLIVGAVEEVQSLHAS